MECTRREALDGRLPALAPAGDLDDVDGVLHHSGRFRTVAQAWHGPTASSRAACRGRCR